MKLNCDMGESFGCWSMGNDTAVMPWVDMANIACGFHASDPDNMVATIALAVANQVEIGAHPGYDDKIGFGRRSISCSPTSVTALVAYQVGALDALCQLQGAQLSYVKPHGALYNDMMKTPAIFQAILAAVAGLNKQRETPLALMILARGDNTQYHQWAEEAGVPLLLEAFADRAYDDQGLLVPRSQPNAVLHDVAKIRQQVAMLAQGKVMTVTGNVLTLAVDTVCVHGDNEASIAMVKTLHEDLHP